jgi:type IX secretion system substrate protein
MPGVSRNCTNGTAIPGTVEVFYIPQSVLDTVAMVGKLYSLANKALGGTYIPTGTTASYADINMAVDAINRGFDKCRIIKGFSSSAEPLKMLNDSSSYEVNGIFKIYPNPNNGNMQVDYSIADGMNGSMEILDITGRELNEFMLNQGRHTITVNGDYLPQGIYFFRMLVNNGAVATKRVAIIK